MRPASFLLPASRAAVLLVGVAVMAPAAGPSLAQPRAQGSAEARDGRTVDWYLRNPYARMGVLDQCTNDPGRLRIHPDCINAQQADLADAARRLTPGPPVSPDRPAWWSANPDTRASVLTRCRRMTPEQRRAYEVCAPARQSIIDEQLRLTGRLPPEVRVQ